MFDRRRIACLAATLAVMTGTGSAFAQPVPPAPPRAATRPFDPAADAAALEDAWTRAHARLLAGDDAGAAKLAQMALGRYRTPNATRNRLIFLSSLATRAHATGGPGMAMNAYKSLARSKVEGPHRTAAGLIVAIDANDHAAENFAALANLAADSDDELLLWATAVEAPALHENDRAAVAYARLLTKWNDAAPPVVFQGYAKVLSNLGRDDESLALRKRLAAADPTGPAYDGLGDSLAALGRFDEAAAAYDEAIKLEPEKPAYVAHRAAAAAGAGRFKEALRRAAQAIEMDPKLADAWYAQGRAQLGLKDPASAEVSLRKAIELDPKPAKRVTTALAEALDAEGLPDQAAAVRKQYGLHAAAK